MFLKKKPKQPCTRRLTRVCASVGFKMRALGVNLIAALELASVNASPLRVG